MILCIINYTIYIIIILLQYILQLQTKEYQIW